MAVSAPDLSNDVGTRSIHNGAHQQRRQVWLTERADVLRRESVLEGGGGVRSLAEAVEAEGAGKVDREEDVGAVANASKLSIKAARDEGTGLREDEGANAQSGRGGRPSQQEKRGRGRGGGGGGSEGNEDSGGLSLDERLHRLEKGVDLWGATYVPPIAPEEWQRLADKWTSEGRNGTAVVSVEVCAPVSAVSRRVTA